MLKRSRRSASEKASKKMKMCLLELSQDENAYQDSLLDWSTLSGYKNGLTVKPSTIPEAGYGLFAARDFSKDSVITEYSGNVFKNMGRHTITPTLPICHLIVWMGIT